MICMKAGERRNLPRSAKPTEAGVDRRLSDRSVPAGTGLPRPA